MRSRSGEPDRCAECTGRQRPPGPAHRAVHRSRRVRHSCLVAVTLVGVLPILVLTVLAAVAPLAPLRVVHPFEAVGHYAAGDRGVDLAGVPGQLVVSATAGTVRFAGPVAGVGVVSVELGDGRRLTYEPVAPSVVVGTHLAAGAPLGRLTVGRANCPAPACLHWGLATGRGPTLGYADPLDLLGGTVVRLLPLTGPPLPGPWLRGGSASPTTGPSTPMVARAGPAGPAEPGPTAATTETSTHRPAATADTIAIAAGAGAGALGLGAAYARRRGRASRRVRGR